MMKKTTSALAVAALLGTGAASAATFQVNDTTSFSVSGDIQMVYQDQEDTDTTIQDNGSSLVFSGATEVDGVTAFFSIDHDSFDDSFDAVGSSGDGDEGHIGIRGAFGDIRFGKESAAYETLDGLFDYQWDLNTTSVSPGDRARVLQYRNSMGDLSYVLGAQLNGEAQEATDGSTTSFAAAASYDVGGITFTAAYDQRANDTRVDNQGTTTGTDIILDNGDDTGFDTDPTVDDTSRVIDDPVYGIAASFDVQNVAISVGYQKDADEVNEADITSVSAQTAVGGVNLYGVYQNVSYDTAPTVREGIRSVTADQSDDSFNEYIVGASYGFGPMTFAAEYLTFDNDNDENDIVSLVAYYGF
jgi:predicted porin